MSEQKLSTGGRYRKRPVEIDAIQLTGGNSVAVAEFMTEAGATFRTDTDSFDATKDVFHVQTLEGEMRAVDGDWIIRGIQDEIYPCKPDIFEATYEAVS